MDTYIEESLHMPNLGISMPRMGIKKKSSSAAEQRVGIADALFSTIQQRLLAAIFGQPDRSFFANELIGLAGGGSGGVQRELGRLEQSGLVTVTRAGARKHYQANPASPIFSELCGIARKTVGLAEPLREALAPLHDQISAAFVYGSVAKRTDGATSDIDLLVLSDKLDYAEVFAALQPAEAQLGRVVNPTVYRPADWHRKKRSGVAFIVKVAAQPKLFVIGEERDLDGKAEGIG